MPQNLDGASDFELLRRSRSGEEGFAAFYRRHERLVAGWLMRQTGRPDLAADLTAEVFAAAYVAAPRFRPGPEPAAAWLLGIARNKLLRSLRDERTEASARRRLAMSRVQVEDDAIAAIASIDQPRSAREEQPYESRSARDGRCRCRGIRRIWRRRRDRRVAERSQRHEARHAAIGSNDSRPLTGRAGEGLLGAILRAGRLDLFLGALVRAVRSTAARTVQDRPRAGDQEHRHRRELARKLDEPFVVDHVNELASAGLIHRTSDGFVFATHAAARCIELTGRVCCSRIGRAAEWHLCDSNKPRR